MVLQGGCRNQARMPSTTAVLINKGFAKEEWYKEKTMALNLQRNTPPSFFIALIVKAAYTFKTIDKKQGHPMLP